MSREHPDLALIKRFATVSNKPQLTEESEQKLNVMRLGSASNRRTIPEIAGEVSSWTDQINNLC